MACQVAPYIKGRKSELYQDILNKVGNDRRVANRLYAISLCLKDELNKRNTNYQGEWDSNEFFERIKIDEILPKTRQIINLGKNYGFIDNTGNYVLFSKVDSIKDKVFQFNQENPNLVAEIEKVKDGFQVKVGLKHDENFSKNTELKSRDAQWSILTNALHNAGFNVDFEEFHEYYNFFNIHNVRARLENLFKYKSGNIIGVRMAQFMIDTMRGTENYDRVKGIFGEDLVNAIVSYSYRGTSLTQAEGTIYEFTDNSHVDRIKAFINDFKRRLSRLDENQLKQQLNAEAERVYKENWNNDNLGASEQSVRYTLKNLYREHKLNMDLVNQTKLKLDRVSNIAKEFSRINAINANILYKKKKLKKYEVDQAVSKLERKIEAGQYFDSITTYLTELVEQIKALSNALNELMENLSQLEDGQFDGEAINTAAGILTKLDYLYQCNYDVIEKLILKDYNTGDSMIEDDDDIASLDIKQKVSDVSKDILNVFNNFRVKQKEFSIDLIYAFLKEQYGTERELKKELIEQDMIDISILSRYIYSIYDCPNELIATLGAWVRQIDLKRDARLRDIVRDIRVYDNKVNGHTKFMFVMDNENVPTGKILSPYNWSKYEQDRADFISELNKLKLDEFTFRERLGEWEKEHNTTITLGQDLYYKFGINIYSGETAPDFENDTSLLKITVPYYEVDGKNIYASNDLNSLTADQRQYYTSMGKLKLELINLVPELAGNFYDAIQLSSDFINSLKNAGSDPKKFAEQMKQKFGDMFRQRVDDTEYGGIATVNGIREDLVDAQGKVVYRLPLFFTHKLEKRSKMSTDYSRSMTAMATSIINYDEMSKFFDILQLTKDFIAKKDVTATMGQSVIGSVYEGGKKILGINTATKQGESRTAGFLNDYWEANVIGRRKKAFVVGNTSIDKIADSLTRYTSVVGLSANVLGAQANLLVGKIQMLIESGFCILGGGEFFSMKDYRKAQAQYLKLMWPCLAEMGSNNKKSKLGLLMDFFDVSSDFFDQLKEQGYHSSALAKILGNSSLFMLYGGGEHMLHAETMLSVLNAIKVKDPNGKEVSLYNALDIKVEDKNGTVVLKDGYTYEGKPIDLNDLNGIVGRARDIIKYCNDSMHGAFGAKDKGMIHRTFFGRMLMNFRQWMPAHYQRRFGKRRYNTILKEDREGFYVSTAKFLLQLARDARVGKFEWVKRWKQLSKMENYNCKRTLSEAIILLANWCLIMLVGSYKDKNKSWARRNLIYQLRRIDLEIGATSFLPLLSSNTISKLFGLEENKSYGGKSFLSPLSNTVKILNSPFSSLNTWETIEDLFAFGRLFEDVQSGKYEGDNLYLHKLGKDVPWISKIKKSFIDLTNDDSMFQYMENN